ncbi:type II toxin-antitoxin system RelE/ParE family toxin [Rhizobium sullae]
MKRMHHLKISPQMSFQLRWTHSALAWLDHIGSYIAKHDPNAARVIERVATTAEALIEHPCWARWRACLALGKWCSLIFPKSLRTGYQEKTSTS